MTVKKKKVQIITMGCSKNLVDSERVMSLFEQAGCLVEHDPESIEADEVIINTCGFIGDAKQESIEMILNCVEAKNAGKIGRLTVMGCLSQRYAKDLPESISEVDRWFGKFDWTKIADEYKNEAVKREKNNRIITTPRHYAFIKISEGCNRFCAFCAIPLITGRHRSRSIEDILEETKTLVEQGVSEFNIIAQDLSSYGTDLYGKHRLAELIEALACLEGVKRIRLHYAYPSDFPRDVLTVISKYPNVCNYLDIALQHISDNVLDNMRRHITGKETRELLDLIRKVVPGIHIRTTLMVGFPGEGEKEFQELIDFVKEQRFERMGAFAYCEEEDTYGAKNFKDSIPEDIKNKRLNQLYALQEGISAELNAEKVGKVFEVVIDSSEDDYWTGRTEFDSPDVDPVVLIDKVEYPNFIPGQYINVRIIDSTPFELYAEPLS